MHTPYDDTGQRPRPGRPNRPLSEKLAEHTAAGPNGCWIWTGMTNDKGYGRVSIGRGVRQLAHRASYEMNVGPVPDGMQIDHRCHNEDRACPGDLACMHRLCINPAHLEAVTARVNILRSPNTVASKWAARTECNNGHPFDDENTAWDPRSDKSGKKVRRCRACGREKARARLEARRAAQAVTA